VQCNCARSDQFAVCVCCVCAVCVCAVYACLTSVLCLRTLTSVLCVCAVSTHMRTGAMTLKAHACLRNSAWKRAASSSCQIPTQASTLEPCCAGWLYPTKYLQRLFTCAVRQQLAEKPWRQMRSTRESVNSSNSTLRPPRSGAQTTCMHAWKGQR